MKRIPASLFRQASAMRAAAALMLEQADALLHGLDEFGGDEEPESPVTEYEPIGDCTHPAGQREASPVMSDPNAFFCKGCKYRSNELTAKGS